MKSGMTPERRVQLKIDGGYDKHGDVFVIARPLTGSVSFPVKTFDGAKAREQFIEEFTFFRYDGRCPSWHSVLFANDCFSDEEKYSDTLKGKSYTSERGKAYVLQLIVSGELVVHCTGSWIPPGDRNHHLPWPTKPKEKEDFLSVVDCQSYLLGPHDKPGVEYSRKTRTMPDEKVVPDSEITKKDKDRESKIPGVDAKIADADINEALQALEDLLEAKKHALSVWNPDTQAEFTHWFGVNSEESRKLIADRIDATLKVVNNFSVDNFEQAEPQNAEEGLYAYVYSTKEDKIYLGNEFGNAPTMGRDSKAGTIAHEISHYNSVGGTDDHEYGEEECAK